MTKRSKNLGLVMPTAAEDAAIAAGIAADPDTMEINAEMAARMQPLRRPGRPKVEQPKVPVTMRVDADVLEAIKASGTGWQTRVNAVLREAVRRGSLAEIPSGQSTLTAIKALPRGVLALTFADGERMQVDVNPIIQRHPTLRELATPAVFKRAKLGEWGGSVTWGTDALELAADNLRARAIEQAGGLQKRM